MTRLLLSILILFIVFLIGVLIGRLIENRSNRKIAGSKSLMETYDKLLKEYLEEDIDITDFFEEQKVAIYGLRGKYGHDFFCMIKRDLPKSVIYSDGNAVAMKMFKGRKVYDKQELNSSDFDFLIILPLNHFDEICNEFIEYGIEREKIYSVVDVLYYMKMRNADV